MYLVVGASGYLGSYVIKNILKNTEENIVAAARKKGREYGPRVQWETCDVSSPQDVDQLCKNLSVSSRGGIK